MLPDKIRNARSGAEFRRLRCPDQYRGPMMRDWSAWRLSFDSGEQTSRIKNTRWIELFHHAAINLLKHVGQRVEYRHIFRLGFITIKRGMPLVRFNLAT